MNWGRNLENAFKLVQDRMTNTSTLGPEDSYYCNIHSSAVRNSNIFSPGRQRLCCRYHFGKGVSYKKLKEGET